MIYVSRSRMLSFLMSTMMLVTSFIAAVRSAFVVPQESFFSDIDGISVAPGFSHICALEMKHGIDIGGKARCWGETEQGQSDPPKEVVFVQLVSGSSFSCGISMEQSVHCWGEINVKQPTGLYTQITASERFACGIRTDNSFSCWGMSRVMDHIPPHAGRKFVQISCSPHHCCALDTNAHALCWGYERNKMETQPPSRYNVSLVQGLDHEVIMELEIAERMDEEAKQRARIAAQQEVIDEEEEEEDEEEEESGGLRRDLQPELEPISAEEEAELVEARLLQRVQLKQVSVGAAFSCGITLNGEDLVCWGGAKTHKTMPRFIKGPWKQVSVGSMGVCAIFSIPPPSEQTDDSTSYPELPHTTDPQINEMRCWGFVTNLVGIARGSQWDQVKVGPMSACAVSMDSQLECWGTGLHDVKRRPTDIIIA